MKVKTGENELKDISEIHVKTGENTTAAVTEIHQVSMQDGKKVLSLVYTFGSGEIKFTVEWVDNKYVRVDVKDADEYTNIQYRFEEYAEGRKYTYTSWTSKNTRYPNSCSDRLDILVRGTNSEGVRVTATSEFILTDAEGWTVFHDVWEEHRQEPTCTEDGWVYYSCDCGHNSTDTTTLPALGHKEDEGTTSDGVITYKCTECGEVLRTEEAPHEHEFGEWVTAVEATCTEAGYEVRECECGMFEERDIPAGHDYDYDTWTYDGNGHHWHQCRNCVSGYTDYTGCSYELISTDGRCTYGRIQTYTCSVCGHTYTKQLEPTDCVPDSNNRCKLCGYYTDIQDS